MEENKYEQELSDLASDITTALTVAEVDLISAKIQCLERAIKLQEYLDQIKESQE